MTPEEINALIGVAANNGAWGILVVLLVAHTRYLIKRVEDKDKEIAECYKQSVADAKSKRGMGNPEGDTQSRRPSKIFTPNLSEEERAAAVKRMEE